MMTLRVPTVQGLIDQRVLINYRVDEDILSRLCPSPFKPQLVEGYGIAGICLIRLKKMRPRGLPSWLGLSSDNAAYRFAVEWEHLGEKHSGVYIPRRETSSRLNVLVGGRLFPGCHHLASLQFRETGGKFSIEWNSNDQETQLSFDGRIAGQLPSDSVFTSIEVCSEFFKTGSLGYSPSRNPSIAEGIELHTGDWDVQPLEISRLRSSFFDNEEDFPQGSITFDSALLMRGIEHEWRSRDALNCDCV